MAHGEDHLGRWVWVTLQGRGQERVTVASMYFPNPPSSKCQETVWEQQNIRLTKINNDQGLRNPINPRAQCLQDFQGWVTAKIQQGEKVVVLTNANQTIAERTQA